MTLYKVLASSPLLGEVSDAFGQVCRWSWWCCSSQLLFHISILLVWRAVSSGRRWVLKRTVTGFQGRETWDRKVKTRPSSVGNLQLVTNKKSLSQPRTAKQMVKKTKTSLTRASCQVLLMNSGRRKRGPWKWVRTKTIRKGILRPKDRRAYSTSDPHPTGSSDWLYLSQMHRFACFASLIKAHGFIALLHWLFTAQSRSLE